MPEGGATGWITSSIAPVPPCGRVSTVERKPFGRRAFLMAQSLRSRIPPKQWIHGSSRALQALRKSHGFCVTGGLPPIASEPTPSPRLWATAPGATPARLCEHTMRVGHRPSKEELSTWQRVGTFYLAPTVSEVNGDEALRV